MKANTVTALFVISQLLCAGTALTAPPDTNTIGWWRFETVGPSIADSSDSGLHTGVMTNMNTGISDGSSGYSTDVPGALILKDGTPYPNNYSLRFDGINDFVDITGDRAGFDLPSVPNYFTIEMFFKLAGTNFPMRFMHLTDNKDTAPKTTISPHLTTFGTTPRLAWSILPSSATSYQTAFAPDMDPSPIALDHWHHFACVKYESDIYTYLDYQLVYQRALLNSDGPFTNFSTITIGAIDWVIVDNAFNGYLDEVRFSNSARNPSTFLRVRNGLPSKIRDVAPSAGNIGVTFVSEEGSEYLVNTAGSTGSEFTWDDSTSIVTGEQFYTTIEINPGGSSSRAIRIER